MHQKTETDILVIGGGIHGLGIAADAAGRGLKVVLCEQGDFASGTSSASSKLIHGGLRYLAQYDFSLVKANLDEQARLSSLAPHLIHPQRFIMPFTGNIRQKYYTRCGLWLYDQLSMRRTLPKTEVIQFSEHTFQLKPNFKTGFSYYDCRTSDARLAIHVALLAAQQGATLLTHTKVLKAKREANHWEVHCSKKNKSIYYNAKVLINAAGPWVEEVAKTVCNTNLSKPIALIKGSHIVIQNPHEHQTAFLLPNDDERVVFAIPYSQKFLLIGTTDILIDSVDEQNNVSDAEINYLCRCFNQYFQYQIQPEHIVHQFWGIRTLLNSDSAGTPSKLSREYYLDHNINNQQAPLVSLIGGKLTTYRLVAEQTVNALKQYFPTLKAAWTGNAKLPGGNLPQSNLELFIMQLIQDYPNLPPKLLAYYAAQYGTNIYSLLGESTSLNQLGHYFGGLLYQKEVDYLKNFEWASSEEDILWRRTQQTLLLSEKQKNTLRSYLRC